MQKVEQVSSIFAISVINIFHVHTSLQYKSVFQSMPTFRNSSQRKCHQHSAFSTDWCIDGYSWNMAIADENETKIMVVL